MAPKAQMFRHRARDCAIHLVFFIIASVAIQSYAAEVIPPKPERYFNDYTGTISPDAARSFNSQLAQFERETSNQFVVAVWDTMPSQSSIEDFTQRTYQAWQIGQQGRNNGVVLFAFIKDRRMRIQPGYGLEGALPDAICFSIINNVIGPRFKTGNYEAGFAAGINAVIAATKGEYKGVGRTVREQRSPGPKHFGPLILFAAFFLLNLIGGIHRVSRKRGFGYSKTGRGWGVDWPSVFIGMGGGGGGSSSNGGGFSGGFSGGGGSSGGGGASGSW
jgi:uncharacterized protein